MPVRTMSVDPGSRVVGYAVFEDQHLIAHGVVQVPKTTDYDKLATYIIARLADVRVKHRCTELALEKAFNWPGHNTAALQFTERAITSWARSVAELYRVERYANGTWKSSVVGHGGATKDDVRSAVRLRYPQLPELTEHEYDAIGIGCHHQGIRHLEGMASE